jgi:ubiquitin carboxyl-terminal hydrolase 36/42
VKLASNCIVSLKRTERLFKKVSFCRSKFGYRNCIFLSRALFLSIPELGKIISFTRLASIGSRAQVTFVDVKQRFLRSVNRKRDGGDFKIKMDGSALVTRLAADGGGTQLFRVIAFQQYRRPYVVEYPSNAIVLYHSAHQQTSPSDGSNDTVAEGRQAYDDDDDPRRPLPEALTPPLFFSELQFRWSAIQQHGRGLVNLGNTCFLNAVLQALTHVPPLHQYLTANIKSKLNVAGAPLDFAFELAELMRELHSRPAAVAGVRGGGGPVRPNFIVSNLRVLSKTYRRGNQACSHEFTQQLLDACHTALLYRFQRGQQKVPYNVTFSSPLFRIVGGQLRSQVSWSKADEIQMLRRANNIQAAKEIALDKSQGSTDQLTSNTYDPFSVLNVPLVGNTLLHCMEGFFAKEVLEGRIYLSPRKVGVKATKCFRLHVLPALLTIHIKRFNARGQKINKAISFPMVLDVEPYCSRHAPGSPKATIYNLTAVIVHIGSTSTSGHYICFVKGRNDTWQLFDDDHVRQVTVDTVKASQAYMLFFTKVNGEQLRPLGRSSGIDNKVIVSAADQQPKIMSLLSVASAKTEEEEIGREMDDAAVARELEKLRRKSKKKNSIGSAFAEGETPPTLGEQRCAAVAMGHSPKVVAPLLHGTHNPEATVTRFVDSDAEGDDSNEASPAEEKREEKIPPLRLPSRAVKSPRSMPTLAARSRERQTERCSDESVCVASPLMGPATFSDHAWINKEGRVSASSLGDSGEEYQAHRQQVVATGQAALSVLAENRRGEENFPTVNRPRHGERFRRRVRDEQYEQEMDKGRQKKVRRSEGGGEGGRGGQAYAGGQNPFQAQSNVRGNAKRRSLQTATGL